MCENYKEELSSSIDRDEVFDELSERIANYWDITIEWETYEQKYMKQLIKQLPHIRKMVIFILKIGTCGNKTFIIMQ